MVKQALISYTFIAGLTLLVQADERPEYTLVLPAKTIASTGSGSRNPHVNSPNIDHQSAIEGFRYTYARPRLCSFPFLWITGVYALSMGTHPLDAELLQIPQNDIIQII